MKRSTLLSLPFLGLTAVLVLAGCSDGNGSNTSRNATVPPFTPANDVQFIDAIIPHHQMALMMAEEELNKGTRQPVKDMAQRMKDAQTAEIATLRSARQALTGSPDVPTPPVDQHMDEDMTRLQQATGAQVDSLFLEHMIAHHSEAISLAHRARPNLQRNDLQTMADNIVGDQAREIGEMQMLRP